MCSVSTLQCSVLMLCPRKCLVWSGCSVIWSVFGLYCSQILCSLCSVGESWLLWFNHTKPPPTRLLPFHLQTMRQIQIQIQIQVQIQMQIQIDLHQVCSQPSVQLPQARLLGQILGKFLANLRQVVKVRQSEAKFGQSKRRMSAE